MTLNPFKRGDIVVWAKGEPHRYIIAGKEYPVEKVDGEYVYVRHGSAAAGINGWLFNVWKLVGRRGFGAWYRSHK